MEELDWIDAATACAVLGVRRQTLYAYVSRRLLRACSDAGDPRRSLYARQDVEGLAAKHRRPRARAEVAAAAIRWGDPVLETSISDVRDGVLRFGSRPAEVLAETMTLEQVAAHHCRVARFEVPEPWGAGFPAGATPLARAFGYLAAEAAQAPPMQGRDRAALAEEGARLMSRVADAMLGVPDRARLPVHARMAAAWGLEAQGAQILRRAVVLLSDHELNPSTFAVRVCASTGAGLAAALLAGLSTLTGPRHGGVASRARQAIDAMAGGAAAVTAFLAESGGLTPYAFGYGHPLYPAGDPRATVMLEALGPQVPAVRQVRALADRLGLPPNVDAGLAALAAAHDLPAEAAFSIFAIGRLAGWIAHAIEQVESGQIIRPRARFMPVHD